MGLFFLLSVRKRDTTETGDQITALLFCRSGSCIRTCFSLLDISPLTIKAAGKMLQVEAEETKDGKKSVTLLAWV